MSVSTSIDVRDFMSKLPASNASPAVSRSHEWRCDANPDTVDDSKISKTDSSRFASSSRLMRMNMIQRTSNIAAVHLGPLC